MIRYLAALVTATLAGVAGVWLVLAPAALGYPGRRVYGSVVSRVDLATGAGLCAVALVTGVVWAIAWRRRLRADGVLPVPRATRAVRPAPVPEEAPTQVIPVPAQLRTTTEPAAAPGPAVPAAAPAAEAPIAGVTAADGTLADGTAADEASDGDGAGAGGDAGVSDLRALLAPLVDALADDVWRTRETAGVGGCAGRAGDDYAEETW